MGVKKNKKTGKKPHKNKPTSKKYSKYKIEGDKITRARSCPRCGPGVFLMVTKDRVYCGKCHYSEFTSKKVVEEKKEVEVKKE
ncbi:MAG: 30S ribosomal protein S27ae [Nanoarchaeota archaeon]|nr:30S ribosomal protein S27ae [Nanoarchaeota archaeon]